MKRAVSVSRTSNFKRLQTQLEKVSSQAVYVGIPSASVADRQKQLTQMANKLQDKDPRKKHLLALAANQEMNNAELLYLFSKGSPINAQPARPVIEAAIVASGNKEAIAHELAEATKAQLNGDSAEASRRLQRAGIAGQNASKKWFKDPRNGWAENATSTQSHKGSDRPGINTGAMMNAITYVVKEEEQAE